MERIDSITALKATRSHIKAALQDLDDTPLAGTFEKVQVARTRAALRAALRANDDSLRAMRRAL